MCRLCNPISRFARPLPLRQQNNQYGDRTNAGGNTIIIAGDNYAPINGGGNVNNGALGCNNNNGLGGGCGSKQMMGMMAKMMQFFMAMFAMMGLQSQLAGDGCGCGCGCNAGLDFLG